MDWERLKRLESATRVGKEVWLNGRTAWTPTLWGIVEDEVGIISDNVKHVIQRIRFADGVSWDGSEYGYKTGAFTYDERADVVKWAQYSQCVSEKEYALLMEKAREKKWPIGWIGAARA